MRALMVFFVVCIALVFGVSSAQAGIIVTEGKVASSGKTTLKSKKSVSLRRVAIAAAADTVIPGSTEDDDSSLNDTEGLDDSDEGDELSDLDNPAPEGWKCEDVGGGVEYCEEDDDDEAGTGAGVGAAGGGGIGDDTSMGAEDPIAGCNGSGGSDSAPWMLAALGLLLFVRRS